jgi:hypothetical protein
MGAGDPLGSGPLEFCLACRDFSAFVIVCERKHDAPSKPTHCERVVAVGGIRVVITRWMGDSEPQFRVRSGDSD